MVIMASIIAKGVPHFKYQKSDSQTIYGRKICEPPFLFHLKDVYLFLSLK